MSLRGEEESGNGSMSGSRLDANEFARHFAESFRPAWLLAVSILGDRTLADDAVQDAALVAWRRIDQYVPGTNFTAWLAQIVRFESLNQRRKAETRRTSAADPAELDATADGHPTDNGKALIDGRGRLQADNDAFDDAVSRALSSLPETARACLLMRVIEGLEYREIAEILGIPEGTAMSHVHRTRCTLRERLDGSAALKGVRTSQGGRQ